MGEIWSLWVDGESGSVLAMRWPVPDRRIHGSSGQRAARKGDEDGKGLWRES